MYKYQFYISFGGKAHTAGSKAIQDCNATLTKAGYQDFTVYNDNVTDKRYLLSIFKKILKIFLQVKSKSIIAIQYPLLSGNVLFKYIIKALRIKKVKFFCIIHDLDALRYSGSPTFKDRKDVENLSYYDCIIVHNQIMKKWLLENGIKAPIIVLEIFDYLTDLRTNISPVVQSNQELKKIVFAGNLVKSNFIYLLDVLENWQFNIYGPNFFQEKDDGMMNLNWKGSFSPDEIINKMDGDFGLIWDGEYIDKLDDVYGNYLKYNNPHKLSLYLAAGLPVIAPKDAAIGNFIKEHNLGILINNLLELKDIKIDVSQYNLFKQNVLTIGAKIKNGDYFTSALHRAEEVLTKDQ